MRPLIVGLTASGTTDSFTVNNYEDFFVEMREGGGTGFNAGTITMQQQVESGGAWASYVIDAAAETWTAADKRRYVDGSASYRFVADSSINDVDIWIAGRGVR